MSQLICTNLTTFRDDTKFVAKKLKNLKTLPYKVTFTSIVYTLYGPYLLLKQVKVQYTIKKK